MLLNQLKLHGYTFYTAIREGLHKKNNDNIMSWLNNKTLIHHNYAQPKPRYGFKERTLPSLAKVLNASQWKVPCAFMNAFSLHTTLQIEQRNLSLSLD